MLWLFIAIACVGILLLSAGLRGRLLGSEPRCRGCGFDLSGLDVNAENAVCPECAAWLSEPKSLRVGRRVKRRGLILAGVVLLVPAIGGALAGSSWTAWNGSKPLVLLKLDVRFGSAAVETAATTEIFDRISNKKLTVAETLSLSAMAAERLGRGPAGSFAWYPMARDGWAAGRISDQDWQEISDRLTLFARKAADRLAIGRYRQTVELDGRVLEFPVAMLNGTNPGMGRPALRQTMAVSVVSEARMLYVLRSLEINGEPMALMNMTRFFNHRDRTYMSTAEASAGGPTSSPSGPDWMADAPPDLHPITFVLRGFAEGHATEGLRFEDLPVGEHTGTATWTVYLVVGGLGMDPEGNREAWGTPGYPVFGPAEISRELTYTITEQEEP